MEWWVKEYGPIDKRHMVFGNINLARFHFLSGAAASYKIAERFYEGKYVMEVFFNSSRLKRRE